MFPGRSCHLLLLPMLLLPPAVRCAAISERGDSMAAGVPGTAGLDSLRSVLKDTVSPAFGATVIIIVTVLVSGSAYLCFLRYVCGGCCQPLQVVPTAETEPNKVEEQV